MNNREIKLSFVKRETSLSRSLALLGVLFTGVCTMTSAQANPVSDFYDYLEQGYQEVASYASKHAGNVEQSKHFAEKAQLAAAEKPIEPDLPTPMVLPQDVRSEMMTARSRLTNALAAGAQDIDPMTTAVAQVNFDCWLAQFEGAAEAGSSACQKLFYSAIAKLPSAVIPAPLAAVPTEDGQVATTSATSISAVGTPTAATSPGPIGGAISAVGGPLGTLGAALDGSVASLNGSVDDTADETSNVASNTAGGALGGVSDAAGGALGGAGDAVGGAVGGAVGSAGGAVGGVGGAVGGVGGAVGGALGGGGLGGLGGGLGGGGGGGN